jgi:AcrR family transcriptional regulator
VTDVDPRIARTRNDVLSAAISVLIDEGWDAVTQPHIARVAGYSKATVYAHWPERIDLLRDAFARYGDMPHYETTGDLRTDLIGELTSFRSAMVDHRLDRAMVVLAERASAVPEIVDIRNAFTLEGERPVRHILAPATSGDELDAAVLMLCGMVLHSVFMHGTPPTDDIIATAVDMTLNAISND